MTDTPSAPRAAKLSRRSSTLRKADQSGSWLHEITSTLKSLPNPLSYLSSAPPPPPPAAPPPVPVARPQTAATRLRSEVELRSVYGGKIDGHPIVDLGSPEGETVVEVVQMESEPKNVTAVEERWDDLQWVPPVASFDRSPGKLYVFVIRVSMSRGLGLSNPYFELSLADQVQETSVSGYPDGRWNTGFEFQVPFHFQLFGTLQLDLYQANSFLMDRHVGRAAIRLSDFENMPHEFTSWYELWPKDKAVGNISHPALQRSLGGSSANLGAVQLRIFYSYQHVNPAIGTLLTSSTPSTAVIDAAILDPTQTTHTDVIASAEVQSNAKDVIPPLAHPRPSTPSTTALPSANFVPPRSASAALSSRSATPGAIVDPAPSRSSSPARASAETTESHLFLVDSMEMAGGGPSDGTLGYLLDYVASATLPAEYASLLRTIARLLALFGQGVEYSPPEMLSGITLLEKYYRTYDGGRKVGGAKGLKEVKRLEVIDEARWNWRFAMAAYGWIGITFQTNTNGQAIAVVSPGKLMRAKPDMASIVEYLQIPAENLLEGVFNDNKVFIPVYYIALDQPKEAIVLAIRGSMSARDALTDLICTYDRHQGGLVHSGMLRAAQWFFANVIPKIREHLSKSGFRKFRIVGHSLGAGTACLLAMLVVDAGQAIWDGLGGEMGIDVSCWAFATPAVASSELTSRQEYKDVIKTVVVAYDMIPRTCYGTFSDLKTLLICAVEANKDGSWDFKKLFTSSSTPSRSTYEKLQLIHECRRRLGIGQPDNRPTHPKLLPAGEILYLLKPEDEPGHAGAAGKEENVVGHGASMSTTKKERQEGEWRLYTVDETEFDELVVRMSMFVDHFPSTYDQAFTAAFYTMMIRSGHILRERSEEVVVEEVELKDFTRPGKRDVAT